MASTPGVVGDRSTRTRTQIHTYQLVARAVREQRPLFAYYEGRLVVMCPHVLGRRAGEWYVLGFGYFDVDFRTLAVPCSWRWLPLRDLEEPEIQGSFWLTAPRETRPSAYFVDAVEAESGG